MSDAWSPEQYHRFRDQRSAPFHDLLALIQPIPGGRAVDLGCGSGELTALMADRTGAVGRRGHRLVRGDAGRGRRARTTRPALLDGDLAAWGDPAVRSTWWWRTPRCSGCPIMPASCSDGPMRSRRRANSRCRCRRTPTMPPIESPRPSPREEPFRSMFDGPPPPDPVADNVLSPRGVRRAAASPRLRRPTRPPAGLRHDPRLVRRRRRVGEGDDAHQVPAAAVPPMLYDAFVGVYRDRLRAELDDQRPYFYAFKRILFWGRR